MTTIVNRLFPTKGHISVIEGDKLKIEWCTGFINNKELIEIRPRTIANQVGGFDLESILLACC